ADYHFWMGNDGADSYQGTRDNWETVSYRFESGTKGININLATGVGTDTYGNAETLLHIDEIDGSRFSDKMVGSSRDNAFIGYDGNDNIDGGAGVDRVIYDREASMGGIGGVIVNLST